MTVFFGLAVTFGFGLAVCVARGLPLEFWTEFATVGFGFALAELDLPLFDDATFGTVGVTFAAGAWLCSTEVCEFGPKAKFASEPISGASGV